MFTVSLKPVRMAVMAALVALAMPGVASAMGEPELAFRPQSWSFQSAPFGQYDMAQVRRGFQVYQQICSNCHSMQYVHFRNLADIGLSATDVKNYAASFKYPGGNDENGVPVMRVGIPADALHAPYDNEEAARAANGGALPPDLSLIYDAREHGPLYIWNLLTGYKEMPPGLKNPDGSEFKMVDGKYYNPYFPAKQLGMPQMINDQSVEFADGSPNSKDDIARDVVAFLAWAAEPELNERKALGIKVMLYLAGLTIFFFALKTYVWRDVKH